jgi:hypothetical protein
VSIDGELWELGQTHCEERAAVIAAARSGEVLGKRGRPLKPQTLPNGYQIVSLNGRSRYAHRAIWESAYGPIAAGLEINHRNGVKSDNRLENLELVTRAENVRHAVELGLYPGGLATSRVRAIRAAFEIAVSFGCPVTRAYRALATVYGCSARSIADCVRRRGRFALID